MGKAHQSLSADAKTAVLLIAHGSRRRAANEDLVSVADALRQSAEYPIVETAYLELAEPTIPQAAARCIEQGATTVLLMPYFLSAGAHVVEDLERHRADLAHRHPQANFRLCRPLGPHLLLVEIVRSRLREAVAERGE